MPNSWDEEVDAFIYQLVAAGPIAVAKTLLGITEQARRVLTAYVDDAVRHRIVAMASSGMSLCSIARILNDEQVPTARGGRWYDSTIAHVVRSVALDGTLAALRISDEAPGSSGLAS